MWKVVRKKKKKKKNKESSSLRVYTKTPSKLHYASITNNEITIEFIRNGDKLISGQTLNQEIETIKNWHEVSLAISRNSTIQKVRNLNLKIISFIFSEFLAKESRRIKIKILSKLLVPRFRSDRVFVAFFLRSHFRRVNRLAHVSESRKENRCDRVRGL